MMSMYSEKRKPTQLKSFQASSSSSERDAATKTKTVSNKTPRRNYKRPLRCTGSSPLKHSKMTYLSESSGLLSLDPITEFPYLEDKFSASVPCSLFSFKCEDNCHDDRTRIKKIRSDDILTDALNIVGRDDEEDSLSSGSDQSSRSHTRSHSPTPYVASVSDDDSDEDSIREDEEKNILRETRWEGKQSRSVAKSCDRPPTCPVRRAQ
mmetsp:Transcript_10107/g.29778  ORF Transcript_10107/g.29778 Transcript_10107/m.29778 type:complete len:208 (+) Transcript_10107:96-719(+)